MKQILFALSAACLLACPTRAAEPAQQQLPAKERFHLFLLVGQSNMAGRGTIEEQDRQPHPRVLMLDQDGRWVPAVDPLHFDKPRVVGVGPGRTFGIQIANANPDITVGLIPCAAGGSPIASWEPGGYHDQTKSHPYDDAIRRARIALKSGTLKAILWHQGESDSQPGKAEVYEAKLHALIARFRRDLNAPQVPFIAGQMGQFPERPWSDAKKLVDRAHRTLPEKVPHTAFVNSDGLTHRGDQVHFNAASYRQLGQRYAEAYQALVASGP
ncbi:MAG TPA: sialate O-acetylesterase [Planctomycetaceae bacterium]|nr:sialate O-acetylesterase [Planctomycetaceae bacterium]HIQ20868.1 sialate O-acetylesterase [Planctomycetota bacterium]